LAAAPPPDAPVWGLGEARSLGAYELYAGVDFGAKVVSPLGQRGGLPTSASLWGGPASLGDDEGVENAATITATTATTRPCCD
jgi:hypothetical protein